MKACIPSWSAIEGGVALTYGSAALLAGTVVALLNLFGWLVLGLLLTGGSIALGIRGDAAVSDPLQRWLDACTFGRRGRRPNHPRYASLEEEQTALTEALYTPVVLAKDFSKRWGYDHYLAELTVFFPGYQGTESRRSVTANGRTVGAIPESVPGGAICHYKVPLDKRDSPERATFNVTYRPSHELDRTFTLTLTVPEPEPIHDTFELLPGP